MIFPLSICTHSIRCNTAHAYWKEGLKIQILKSFLSKFIHRPISNDDESETDVENSSDDESSLSSSLSEHHTIGMDNLMGPPVKQSHISTHSPTTKTTLDSSVHQAINAKAPLLAFFKPCSHKEYLENLARDVQQLNDDHPIAERREAAARNHRLGQKRELAKL
jgi:hypothetical protein